MSAETLRKAATLMREQAEAATPGPWEIGGPGGTWIWGALGACVYAPHHDDGEDCDVPHIASWHPDVALAAAELLDSVAAVIDSWHSNDDERHLPAAVQRTLTFARTYLGEVSR